jgi:hypothetical protein
MLKINKAKMLKMKRRRWAWKEAEMIAGKDGKIKNVKVLGRMAFIKTEHFLPGTPQNITISGLFF